MLIRRRPTRETNIRHRHDALTPRKKVRSRQLLKSLRRNASMRSQAYQLAHFLATYVILLDENGMPSESVKILSQIAADLYTRISYQVYVDTVRFVFLNYTLSQARTHEKFSLPRNRYIDDLEESWAYQYTRCTKSELCMLMRFFENS